MLYNTSLFDRFDASGYSGDYTGLIGITGKTVNDELAGEKRSYYNHVYVHADENKRGATVESCGSTGITKRKSNIYTQETKYYLELKLKKDRKI
ncbi:MAG TPA: hypothetical protein PK926_16965 [Spirochaetota bacterium]|nr:hypothetical protein [Spirochaetota bacterium]HPI90751.1 hypothetical protein [Spirochaetota bacterium]HPR49374.1 hypothetical protein [Spirochaetota bacterium]